MAVVDFGFAQRILVLTMCNGHFLFQVMQAVQRRIQHRKQERACQEELPYDLFVFQTATNVKELRPSFGYFK